MKLVVTHRKISALLLSCFLFTGIKNTTANNLSITNTSVSGSNITFTISWDNSWHVAGLSDPNNWDAAWVYVKYQDCATNLWKHATLSTTTADHSTNAPLQVDAVTDGKGVFVRRFANGGGSIPATSVTLKMNIPTGTYNYKVLGTEMVHVPAGSFYIGDGDYDSYEFKLKQITNVDQSNGISLYYYYNGSSTTYYNITSSFPMGVNAFYCMKYEITQGQYVDFLNSLTIAQQVARTTVDPTSSAGTYAMEASGANRNRIVIATPGTGIIPATYACNLNVNNGYNSSDDGQSIACNYLSDHDLFAYLDWSGLRPMTELEFEKVCRGPQQPVLDEYPWGNTVITPVNLSNFVNPGTVSEGFNNTATGLSNYNKVLDGPVRVGFAATGSTSRITASASYYGAMNMGDNVLDKAIKANSSFDFSLGTGDLDVNGNTTISKWVNSYIFNKGGSWTTPSTNQHEIQTSSRSNSNFNPSNNRSSGIGGRGVR